MARTKYSRLDLQKRSLKQKFPLNHWDVLLLSVAFLTICLLVTCQVYSGQLCQLLKCGSRPESSQDTSPTLYDAQCHVTFDSDKFDCWPESTGATEESCKSRGCCWLKSIPGIPSCFYPKNFTNVYSVTSSKRTASGIVATLERSRTSPYPNDVMKLKLNVSFVSNELLRFRFTDPRIARYEVPIELPGMKNTAGVKPEYDVTLSEHPFAIKVRRKSTGDTLFDSTGTSPLIYADQYLQISTKLTTKNIYGLGEHRSSLKLDTLWSKIVIWARAQPPIPDENLYGSHPFYMNLDEKNNAHGVFLLNSNAMQVDLQPHQSSAALTYRTIGGILDFFIFLGPSPDDVVRQYQTLIGYAYLPPFWALGFHLCRYGYNSAAELKKVIERNRAAMMPYDTQWNDIDYMQGHLDWTYDNKAYAGLPGIVQDLHQHNQRYVIIVDPGISNNQTRGTYPPYDEGLQQGVFVKASNGSNLVGRVWPGDTVFPDFFNPRTESWWYNQAQRYHRQIPFDGLWTDMNEPTNFGFGSVTGCTNSSLDKPPFVPPTIDGGTLLSKTICPSAIQNTSTHYNLHSLYGFSETRTSMAVLKRLRSKRSIVISRSTFPGSGRYGGHWSGDNKSKWSDLYYSIPEILNFQMFGIPLVGADICGFNENTTPELCTRWTQLGSFYPFMRNHNSYKSKDQDPGSFDNVTQGYIRSALQTRYTLLPFLYTLFYRNSIDGTPVARPLFFQFPGEAAAVDTQFMWGSSLLISPVLKEGNVTVTAYIPNDVWYDFYNGSQLSVVGQDVVLDAPLSKINVHVRGGSILPTKGSAVTTTQLRLNMFALTVALSANGSASGEVFWDDGESLDTVQFSQYSLVTFQVVNKVLTNTVVVKNYTSGKEMFLEGFAIFGVDSAPGEVKVNGVEVWSNYSWKTRVLRVSGITVNLLEPLTVSW